MKFCVDNIYWSGSEGNVAGIKITEIISRLYIEDRQNYYLFDFSKKFSFHFSSAKIVCVYECDALRSRSKCVCVYVYGPFLKKK